MIIQVARQGNDRSEELDRTLPDQDARGVDSAVSKREIFLLKHFGKRVEIAFWF